ncbi:hypothetical protein LTR85_000313 [Meristemomyces frigidus]|nr:hypothetical protein LTR85_000313 [Meristemomyces frigidus]
MVLKVLVLCLLCSAFADVLAALPASVLATEAQGCCNALDNELHRVIRPGTQYDAANVRWSVTAMLHPTCIAQPTDTAEVAQAVKILTAAACPFAVKSGGHTPTPGANDINHGVTVDLRYINQTTLSADRGSVTLGVGSTWLNAYTNLNDTGVAFPGGRYGLVGVGGITLGGGLSFFSPKVGWVADNVVEFEVVLASGEVVNASSASHSDLFRALKGGSGNFGIVTRVEIRTFVSDGRVWGGSVAYPCTDNTTGLVLSAVNNFTTNNHLDQDAAFNSNFIYNTTTGTKEIANTLFYAKDVADRPIFNEAQSIQPQLANTAASTTIVELAADTASLPYGYRYLGATVTFKNTLKALTTAQRITDAVFQTVSNVTDLQFTFVYEPIPRLYTQHSLAQGGNVLGLDDTVEDLISAFASWAGQMEEAMSSIGAYERFTYLNYAASSQNPLASYGDANVRFLEHVATRYDPEGVFQTLVPGGFKISKVG